MESAGTEGLMAVVEELILARLLDPGKAGLSTVRVSRDIEGIFAGRCPAGDWPRLFRAALESLRAKGAVVLEKRGKTERLALAGAGRRAAIRYLGVDSLPAGVPWKEIRDGYLVARALGIRGRSPEILSRLKTVSGVRGAILRRRYGLPTAECPKADEALRALLWRMLGADGNPPFTLKAVQEFLLGKLIDSPRKLDLSHLKALIPAEAVGARRVDARELRRALLEKLASGDEAAGEGVPADPGRLAREILDAARRSRTGWFGPDRIFISHAWRSFLALHGEPGMDLAGFKARLADLNRSGLISLSRADLVEAMSPEDVSESETVYLNARFHFLRVPGGRS